MIYKKYKVGKMTKKILFILIFLCTYIFSQEKDRVNERWYTQEYVKKGKKLFIKNCSSCHGFQAQKTLDWKRTLADGSYPPPPLNGTAHAWHHPKSQLERIILNGGQLYNGKMPAFKNVLNKDEINYVISYFQNYWSNEIYNTWFNNAGLTR